jgi:hypothetical protein
MNAVLIGAGYIFALSLALSVGVKSAPACCSKSPRTVDETSTSGGIRELIPEKYQKRYQQWKGELLSTETGYKQWQAYADDANFVLTVRIGNPNRNGGETGSYKWDQSGKLVAATITLGSRIDEGFPTPVYYPVMNALQSRSSSEISGSILAATKIAHEFGHLNQMRMSDGSLYRAQASLVPVYNSILLSNRYNTNDPRLLELSKRMGGTPVQLWENREYWGEVNAMLFLRDRFASESFKCVLFHRIKKLVELYAPEYADRFEQIARSDSFSQQCEGW